MQNNHKENQGEKKVLLRITDLKQWFPIKKTKLFQKEQLYVRANDGITLDIYEGETVGLVGESGCGKSTFGRTLLQIYPQTEGKTMYYGRSLTEMAPDYVEDTVKSIGSRKKKIAELEKKVEGLKAEYEKMEDGAEKFQKQEECENLRKECNREFLDLVQIIGGFYAVDNTQEAEQLILEKFKVAKVLRNLREEDKTEGKDKSSEIAVKEKELAAAEEKLTALRAKYSSDLAFQKYEEYKDNGVDLARLKTKEMRILRKDMQMIFQDPYASLNPRMTVGEIIKEPMKIFNIYDTDEEREARVRELLDIVSLKPDHIRRYPAEFSGGQRQRIGIARALAVNPKFIVCDEPISALDASIQAQVINLLKHIQKEMGISYIFIAHDLGMVKHISDRIGVMYLGHIVECGPSDVVYHTPLHPYTQALLSAIPIPDPDVAKAKQRIVLEGEIPSPINTPAGCPFASRCPRATERCRKETPKPVQLGERSVACFLYEK